MADKEARRTVIRLRVIHRRVTCPFGRNDGNGGRYLRDCFLDSLTPGHACRDPQKSGATRCPQVAKWHKKYGWREHQVSLGLTSVNERDEPHQEFPLDILYTALNREGTRWMAVNNFTGQRFEVRLHADYPRRRTVDGDDVELFARRFDMRKVRNGDTIGGVVGPWIEPIWNGLPHYESWSCSCSSCRPRKEETSMSIGTTRRPSQDGFPVSDNAPAPLDPSEVPSAQVDATPARQSRYFSGQKAVAPPYTPPRKSTAAKKSTVGGAVARLTKLAGLGKKRESGFNDSAIPRINKKQTAERKAKALAELSTHEAKAEVLAESFRKQTTKSKKRRP